MLKIDNELKSLIPPLSREEFEQLEKNILAEGIRDPITLWSGTDIIIDGHNRYSIAQKHNLKYKTYGIGFDSREEVKQWMILNQLGRRNLADFVKYELLEQYEEIEKQKGKEKQQETTFANMNKNGNNNIITSVLSNTDNADKKTNINPNNGKHDTRKVISDKLDWSTGKTAQAKIVKEKAPEVIKEKCRTGEISINQAYEATKQIDAIKESEAKEKVIEAIKAKKEAEQKYLKFSKSIKNIPSFPSQKK